MHKYFLFLLSSPTLLFFDFLLILTLTCLKGFPGGSVVNNLPANAGDTGSIFGSGGSPGEGNGNSFHYSSLENSIDRRAQWVTVHGVARVSRDTATKQQQQDLSLESQFARNKGEERQTLTGGGTSSMLVAES